MSFRGTKGTWIVEAWSGREAQVVAINGEKRTLICAGVMPEDAKIIAAAGNAAQRKVPADISPMPWKVREEETASGVSAAIVDARGGIVCLMKNGGGRKAENGRAIEAAFKGA